MKLSTRRNAMASQHHPHLPSYATPLSEFPIATSYPHYPHSAAIPFRGVQTGMPVWAQADNDDKSMRFKLLTHIPGWFRLRGSLGAEFFWKPNCTGGQIPALLLELNPYSVPQKQPETAHPPRKSPPNYYRGTSLKKTHPFRTLHTIGPCLGSSRVLRGVGVFL